MPMGFNTGSCPSCGHRFQWAGEITDRPACRQCGHKISESELQASQNKLDEARKILMDAFDEEDRQYGNGSFIDDDDDEIEFPGFGHDAWKG